MHSCTRHTVIRPSTTQLPQVLSARVLVHPTHMGTHMQPIGVSVNSRHGQWARQSPMRNMCSGSWQTSAGQSACAPSVTLSTSEPYEEHAQPYAVHVHTWNSPNCLGCSCFGLLAPHASTRDVTLSLSTCLCRNTCSMHSTSTRQTDAGLSGAEAGSFLERA